MHRWNKGFLLIDSLLSVFIVSLICTLCFSIYKVIDSYAKGYERYQETSNESYERILRQLYECEACTADESD